MRSVPPAGGAMRLTVRPARSSPVAYTVSFNGPLITLAVGTLAPRSGITGAPVAKVAATAATATRTPSHMTRFAVDDLIILFSGSDRVRDGGRRACRRA